MSAQRGATRAGTFAPLANRNYRLLWLGQSSHAFALWMEQIARPFLVLELTNGSAAHVGGVLAVRTLPQLFFGVFAGVISDWFDRRTILLVTKWSVLTISVAFAGLLVIGRMELWHVYVFQFIRGSFMAFDQPARQSMIAEIVPAEQMIGGVALMSATQNVMRIVGSSAGGFAIPLFGMTGTFIGVAVVYIGAVIATTMLRVPTHKKPEGSGARAMAGGLKEGAVFAWQHTTIRAILLMSLVYFTFGMSYTQVFVPLFAKEVMGIGEGGSGLMVSLTGVGALVSALFVASRQPTRVGLALPAIVTSFGATLVAFAVTTYLPRPMGLVLPFLFITLTGVSQTMYFSLSNASLLNASPPEMRGRVISLLSLDRAMMSLGGMGAGFLADLQGVQIAQITYGAVCALGGLAILLMYRELREVRLEPGQVISTGRHTAVAPAAIEDRSSTARGADAAPASEAAAPLPRPR